MSWKDRATKVVPAEGTQGSWKDRATKVESAPDVSMAESAGRGLAQSASMGFADELTGGAEALWEMAKGNPKAFGELYKQFRDESRANYKAAEEANPNSYMAGQVGGAIGTAIGTAAAIPGLGGAGLAKLAAQGAAQRLGSSEADLTQGDIAGAVKDTAIGGGIGLAAGGLGKLASAGMNKLTPKIAGNVLEAAEDISMAQLLNTQRIPGQGAYTTVGGKVFGGLEKLEGATAKIAKSPRDMVSTLLDTEKPILDRVLGGAGVKPIDNIIQAVVNPANSQALQRRGLEEATKFSGKELLKDLGSSATVAAAHPFGLGIVGGAGVSKGINVGLNKALNAGAGIAGKLSTETVESLAPQLGRYGPILIDAAQRGGQSLTATHYVLQQTDPEYQKAFKAIQEDDNGEEQGQ